MWCNHHSLKIFYAIQATGSGHVSRAMEIIPYLQQYGEVDIFLSGSNAGLEFAFPVKYRSCGMSIFLNSKGGIDYKTTLENFAPIRIRKEAKDLPVEKYDVVINDFERITHLACRLKKIPYVHFGHQASFVSNLTPRPHSRDFFGEMILKKYVHSPHSIGLHFDNYDKNIYQPIIKQSILNATPVDKGHVTVYVGHYSSQKLMNFFSGVPDLCFHLFTKDVKSIERQKNVILHPLDNHLFTKSMTECSGVITGGGFETPSEAMYLGKKLMSIPIRGHYEQQCNAHALKKMRVTVEDNITEMFALNIQRWINSHHHHQLVLTHDTREIVQKVVEMGLSLKKENNFDTHVSENLYQLPV